jgi:drug/metabolite transporter (DMT)-like permease
MSSAALAPVASARLTGILLVALAGLFWSTGGTFSRFISVEDPWTVVFWRGIFAGTFLIAFMLAKDGLEQTRRSFTSMGLPGLVVALCFTVATTCFVFALTMTKVANIVLLQAATPMIAALISWIFLRERIGGATWAAIAAVALGVAVMISESFDGNLSFAGDGLALLIAAVFALAIVLTQRFSNVAMMPAICLGVLVGVVFAATQASGFAVSARDAAFLAAFGAINLGAGLAVFSLGARLIPSTLAALLSLIETMLSPLWVWLFHDEAAGPRALIGGAIILAAIIAHILWQAGPTRAKASAPG